jgi:hypothetical protein
MRRSVLQDDACSLSETTLTLGAERARVLSPSDLSSQVARVDEASNVIAISAKRI